MRLSRYEQETIISYNNEEETANVYTFNAVARRKLERLSKEYPDKCRLCRVAYDGQAAEYSIPKSWIRINPPRKAAPLTEEQKQARRDQLARIRAQNPA